jgi:hypothetical protein
MNLYQYVSDAPTSYLDPSGLYKVCCRGIKDPSLWEKPWRHCDIQDQCSDGDEPHDVWKDPSSTRKLDDGCTTCDKATDAQIAECMKRHPYDDRGNPDQPYDPIGNNCQTNTMRRLSYCCLKSNWMPDYYAGDRRKACLEWKYITIYDSPGIPVVQAACVKWQYFPDFYDPNVPTSGQ